MNRQPAIVVHLAHVLRTELGELHLVSGPRRAIPLRILEIDGRAGEGKAVRSVHAQLSDERVDGFKRAYLQVARSVRHDHAHHIASTVAIRPRAVYQLHQPRFNLARVAIGLRMDILDEDDPLRRVARLGRGRVGWRARRDDGRGERHRRPRGHRHRQPRRGAKIGCKRLGCRCRCRLHLRHRQRRRHWRMLWRRERQSRRSRGCHEHRRGARQRRWRRSSRRRPERRRRPKSRRLAQGQCSWRAVGRWPCLGRRDLHGCQKNRQRRRRTRRSWRPRRMRRSRRQGRGRWWTPWRRAQLSGCSGNQRWRLQDERSGERRLRRALRKRRSCCRRALQLAGRRNTTMAKAARLVVVARHMVAGGLAVPRAPLHLEVPHVRRRCWPTSIVRLALRKVRGRVEPGVALVNRRRLRLGNVERTSHLAGGRAVVGRREHGFRADWSRALLARLPGRSHALGRCELTDHRRPLGAAIRGDYAAARHAHE